MAGGPTETGWKLSLVWELRRRRSRARAALSSARIVPFLGQSSGDASHSLCPTDQGEVVPDLNVLPHLHRVGCAN